MIVGIVIGMWDGEGINLQAALQMPEAERPGPTDVLITSAASAAACMSSRGFLSLLKAGLATRFQQS